MYVVIINTCISFIFVNMDCFEDLPVYRAKLIDAEDCERLFRLDLAVPGETPISK